MFRRWMMIAMLVTIPGAARAQFTTFIPPKPKVADSVKAVVAAVQKAQADSAEAARITNMKTWVDSAAGLPPTPTSPVTTDSLAGTLAADSAAMRNGARAPATASPLPLMLALGLVGVTVGWLLLAGTPAREKARRA